MNHEKALEYYLMSSELFEKIYKDEHPMKQRTLYNCASIYYD